MFRFESLRHLRAVFVTLALAVALLIAVSVGAQFAWFKPGAVYWSTVESTVRVEFPDSIMAAAPGDTSGGGTAGTGLYITPHLILTCAHIGDTARHCFVRSCYEGDSAIAGRVLFADTLRDVAVIFTETTGAPLRFADDMPAVGESVSAIGNPEGYIGTFSLGVVSQYRTDEESGNTTIQCTAAAQPGSSGGPLLNGNGEVVGMVAEGGEGFTFAIDVKSILSVLIRMRGAYLSGIEYPQLGDKYSEAIPVVEPWPVEASELSALLDDYLSGGWDWDMILSVAFVFVLLAALVMTLHAGFAKRRKWARERHARQEWEAARCQAFLPEACIEST